VGHPINWPWSSWSFYENGESELIQIEVVKPRRTESQKPHPLNRRVRHPVESLLLIQECNEPSKDEGIRNDNKSGTLADLLVRYVEVGGSVWCLAAGAVDGH